MFINPETGTRWIDIKRAWERARTDAGLGHVWFHDLRRSFVTNARRRGVPESVVMRMSGHRTRSVFDRYNIVEEEDLRTAVSRIEVGREENSRKQRKRCHRAAERPYRQISDEWTEPEVEAKVDAFWPPIALRN